MHPIRSIRRRASPVETDRTPPFVLFNPNRRSGQFQISPFSFPSPPEPRATETHVASRDPWGERHVIALTWTRKDDRTRIAPRTATPGRGLDPKAVSRQHGIASNVVQTRSRNNTPGRWGPRWTEVPFVCLDRCEPDEFGRGDGTNGTRSRSGRSGTGNRVYLDVLLSPCPSLDVPGSHPGSNATRTGLTSCRLKPHSMGGLGARFSERSRRPLG